MCGSKYEMTNHYFKKSLTIKDELQKKKKQVSENS